MRAFSFMSLSAALVSLMALTATGPARAQSTPLDIERSPVAQGAQTGGALIGPAPEQMAPDAGGGDLEMTEPGQFAASAVPTPISKPAYLGGGAVIGGLSGLGELNSALPTPQPVESGPSTGEPVISDAELQNVIAGIGTPTETAEAQPEPAPAPKPRRTRSAPKKADGPSSPTLAAIVKRGTLRVGTVLKAPYAMRDAVGEIIGHEVDLAYALADTLNVDVEIIPTAEDLLLSGLKTDRYDLVLGGVAIAPEQALRLHFTTPYAKNGIQLVTTRKLARRRATISRFSDPDISIAVAANTADERMAQVTFPDAQIVRYADQKQAQAAFLRGDIPAMIAPSPFPEVLAAQSPKDFALPLDAPLSQTAEAMVIAQGDPEFLAYLNAWIVARTVDDFLAKTRDYWFGGTQWLPRLTQRPRIDSTRAAGLGGR